MRMVLVMFLVSSFQLLCQLVQGLIYECLDDVSVFDLLHSLSLYGFSYGSHALLAVHADIGEVLLRDAKQVDSDGLILFIRLYTFSISGLSVWRYWYSLLTHGWRLHRI